MYTKILQSIFACLLVSASSMGETDPLGDILTGISVNAKVIKNISFDYSIEYRLSEQWKAEKLERWHKMLQERGHSDIEQLQRAPSNENTLRSGTFIRDADAFKITSKREASADSKVFYDENMISDGVKVTEINNTTKSAVISHAQGYRNPDLSFFPDNFQNLFLDGKTLPEMFESDRYDIVYIGSQSFGGVECEVLEATHYFTMPEDVNQFTKDRVWIAPQSDFLIKQGISFKTDPDKPINRVSTEFSEISEGIWYYTKILFESFPLENTEPDVSMCLTISNLKINQSLPPETFVADSSNISHVTDETK